MMFLKWLDLDLLEGDSIEDYDNLKKAYYSYLESVKPYISSSVYSYAVADWHYDATIHFSPHDASLKEVIMKDDGSDGCGLSIHLSFLGAYRDYNLNFIYENVQSYSIKCEPSREFLYDNSISINGEFLWDSIEVDAYTKLAKHYIVFSSGTKIIIECKDFNYIYSKLE